MKRHIQIKSSYWVWRPSDMRFLIRGECEEYSPEEIKNIKPLIIEWWLHNIGYYITKPFVRIPKINALNLRFKDVDLMVEMKEEEK